MLDNARNKVLRRVFEEIGAFKFNIKEDITIIFKGSSYNIIDSEGNLVKKLGISDRLVEGEEVLT